MSDKRYKACNALVRQIRDCTDEKERKKMRKDFNKKAKDLSPARRKSVGNLMKRYGLDG